MHRTQDFHANIIGNAESVIGVSKMSQSCIEGKASAQKISRNAESVIEVSKIAVRIRGWSGRVGSGRVGPGRAIPVFDHKLNNALALRASHQPK